MENEAPIYLQTCTDCGRPALTFDEQRNALCVNHAAVFLPADGSPQDEGDDKKAS